jgi:hypothetical protein
MKSAARMLPAAERVKELAAIGNEALHRQRACFETRPRALLSMKRAADGVKNTPHPEEAARRPFQRACAHEGGGRTVPIQPVFDVRHVLWRLISRGIIAAASGLGKTVSP